MATSRSCPSERRFVMLQNDRRPLNRRRLLRGATLAGAGVALAAAGCGKSGAPSPSAKPSGAQQPKKGGVLTYAGGAAGSYDTQGRTFDPMIQTQFGAKSYT